MRTAYRFGYPALAALLLLCGCATNQAPRVVAANPRLPDPPARAASGAPTEQGWVRVGRYSAVRPGPTAAQRDPLQAMVHVKLPRRVRTVGQAVRYTLRRSGYRLGANVGALHNREIPQVHRDLGPMTLAQALQTLAGPAYQVQPDYAERTVAFRLSPAAPAPAEPVTPAEAIAAASQVKEQAPSAPAAPSPTATGRIKLNVALAAAAPGVPKRASREPSDSIWALAAAASRVKEPAAPAPRRYGPVHSGQMLRPIADQLSAGTALNTEQMMLALLQANPDAFGKVRGRPNINALRCRAVLNVPDAQAEPSYSAQAASREVHRQARQWRRNPVRGGGCVA